MKARIKGTALESRFVEGFEPLTCTQCKKKAVQRTIGYPGVPGLYCTNCGCYFCIKTLPDDMKKEWGKR